MFPPGCENIIVPPSDCALYGSFVAMAGRQFINFIAGGISFGWNPRLGPPGMSSYPKDCHPMNMPNPSRRADTALRGETIRPMFAERSMKNTKRM